MIGTLQVFNTVLGEELLFRGLLLPRMGGAFGRPDWIANGLLLAFYYVHVPWVIPATLLDTFIIAYPVKRYRSALLGMAVHSSQSDGEVAATDRRAVELEFAIAFLAPSVAVIEYAKIAEVCCPSLAGSSNSPKSPANSRVM